jgi:hypothetical protein
MEERPAEKKVSFLLVIFLCLVIGACALAIVNYLLTGKITADLDYQKRKSRSVESELDKIKKPVQQPPENTIKK